MKLSIILPCYNEAAQIRSSIETIIQFCRRELNEWEILVVDDGSSDQTMVASAEAGRVKCLRNARNRGKGYSVRRGMLAAAYDPALFSDADLSTPIEEALALYQALEEGADIAIASRRRAAGKDVRRKWYRRVMASTFRWLVKLIALRGFYDTQCGFKMFRQDAIREVFPLQTIERWGFDVELLYIARKKKLRVVEVPVAWHEAEDSRLSSTAPLTMIGDLVRVRWNDLRGRYGKRRPSLPASEQS